MYFHYSMVSDIESAHPGGIRILVSLLNRVDPEFHSSGWSRYAQRGRRSCTFNMLLIFARSPSEVKQLLDLRVRIIRIENRMSNRPRIRENLVVIATRESLVAKEVDSCIFDPTGLLGLPLQMSQTVSLIPTLREYVERDLATN